MILGLDISTSISGATILDHDTIVYNESWDFRNKKKYPTIYSKARLVKEKLLEIRKAYDITTVVIEKPFTFFKGGASHARTMSVLQNFNGMVSWISCDVLGVDPQHITAQQARKALNLKIKRGEDAKQKCLEYVLAIEPSFVVNYTRFGNVHAETYDRSDSYVVAKAGLLIEF
tara:strand:+ start:388 stop:906 length:519 start_codon:yes stop_codon:yes gene_type:complete